MDQINNNSIDANGTNNHKIGDDDTKDDNNDDTNDDINNDDQNDDHVMFEIHSRNQKNYVSTKQNAD